MVNSGAEYRFAPAERPTLPGSPFAPRHGTGRRVAYVAAAVVVGIAATLPNAVITVNIASLAGGFGVYPAQLGWLPAVYVAANASANLLLVKARIQFGIPAVTATLLLACVAVGMWQLQAPSLGAAIAMRAASGIAAAGLTTIAIYDLMQAASPKTRVAGLAFGVIIPQLGTPLARMLPVEMLALDGWVGLQLLEIGMALTALVVMLLVRLPPSERSAAFEPLDFVTFALLAPALVLVCGVLAQGRLLWWTDTPWLGWALAAAVPLFAAAILVERGRVRPLLQIRWLGSAVLLRFAAVAILVRIALAEQTYGAVGLLTSGGLTNEQLRILFSIVLLAMVLGGVVAVLTLSATRLPHQVLAATLIIALGAWLDSDATSLTRPPQLYLSQALIAFGASLFIGPALLYGLLRVLQRGPDVLVSFIVLFSITQNIGGLAGSALLGSCQVSTSRVHAQALAEHLQAGNPQVAERIRGGSVVLGGAVTDPALRAAQGGGLLSQALAREANVLAFNHVFRLVALLALATAGYVCYLIALTRYRRAPIQPARAHDDRRSRTA